jgi:hypothetical protein
VVRRVEARKVVVAVQEEPQAVEVQAPPEGVLAGHRAEAVIRLLPPHQGLAIHRCRRRRHRSQPIHRLRVYRQAPVVLLDLNAVPGDAYWANAPTSSNGDIKQQI